MKVCLRYRLLLALLAIGATFLWNVARASAQEPSALPNAHAHNDYEHPHPLLDALAQGFCSVEADIYLVEGQLLIAHERKDVRPDRTLQSLYLDPLRERARKNKGHIYKDSNVFYLLIDVKSDAEPTYAALRKVLEQYSDVLTEFREKGTRQKAVTAVVSGNRDIATMKIEKRRFAGIDGRMEDLDSGLSAGVFPWISNAWGSAIGWNGSGEMPDEAKKRLYEIVEKAHRHGYKVRFWGAPDTQEIWTIQREAGVDLLNADDLPALRTFLLAHPSITH